jgi:hypothetical protein
MKMVSKNYSWKWTQTAVLVVVNFLLWAIPSNVAYLIAQNRDVLLGRYGVTRLTWMFLMIPISLMALYLIWSNEKNKKKRQFQIISLTLSIIAPLILIDVFMRLTRDKHYIIHRGYYHLAPHKVFRGTFHDVPENAYSYPNMRPGYPDIEYSLTTDKRGFRNKTDLDKYDIVVLGDSFAEGSNVTDDQIWAHLLAQKGNLTVYNLGMAAGHSGTYLETFKRFGVDLSPKLVLCMVYEGNDFRDSNFEREDTLGYRLSGYFKRSPLRLTLENLMIRHLGTKDNRIPENPAISGRNRTNNKTNIDPALLNALSWLPIAVPDGPDEKSYAFTVKSLLADFENRESFLHSKGYQKTLIDLRQIKKMCNDKNINLVIVYAPDKPHVLLPLIQSKVPAEKLRAFMALKQDNLPPTEEIMETILARVEIRESAVEEFCRSESIGFISLTEPMRKGITGGQQLYFTYDDHWTPLGHEVVANTISHYIDEHPVIKNK